MSARRVAAILHWPRPWNSAGFFLALVALYFAAGKLGLTFAHVHGSVSLVWPPSGIAIAALVLFGIRWWPAILLGSLLVNLSTTGSPISSLGIAIGNALEAVLGAALMLRFAGGVHAFDRVSGVFMFTLLSGMVSTAVAATFGVSSLALDGLARWSDFGRLWQNWWVGDFAGVIVFTPLAILWRLHPRVEWSRARVTEGALLALAAAGMSVVTGLPADPSFGAKFLCLPVLLWVAFRFTPREASTATAIVSLLLPLAAGGAFRIEANTAGLRLELLQLFICVAGVTVLAVAAMVSDLRRIEASVRAAYGELGLLHERQSGDLSRAVGELAVQVRARRRAETFAEAIVDTMQEPLLLLDEALTVQAVNAAYCAMFRTSREAAENRPLSAVGRHWDNPSIRAMLREALARETPPEPREVEVEEESPRTLVVSALRLALGDAPAPLVLLTMRDVTAARHAIQELRASEERFRAVVETAVDGIITSDRRGHIVSLNRAAMRIFGYADHEGLGLPVSRLIRGRLRDPGESADEPFPHARKARAGAPLERTGVRRDGTEFPAEVAVTSWRSGTDLYITAIVRDITERKAAERRLREVSGRLLQIRDEEQRRIARELHDGTGQKIWAMSLNLAHLKRAAESLGPRPRAALAELVELANQCAREIRDIASLLHPPLLEGVGVSSAIRSHVDSFVRRTGIQVSVVLPPELGPLPPEVETTIFRIVQECLTNIQRHAASRTATVRVESGRGEVRVEVSDEGRGMPRDYGLRTAGVGIHAMSGRVRQLDGQLEIDSAIGRGTRVRVIIPVPSERPRHDEPAPAGEALAGDEPATAGEQSEGGEHAPAGGQ